MAMVQSEPARLLRAYRSGVSTCALVMLPTITVGILADEIALLLLGRPWIGVVDPLRILAWAMLFRTSYKISDTIARATGAVYERAWRQAIFAAAVLGGAYLGQPWGIQGVACGVFAALGLNFLLMAHLSLRLTGMTWSGLARAHVPGVVLAVVVGVTAAVAASWLRAEFGSPLVTVTLTVGLAGLAGALAVGLAPSFFIGPTASRSSRRPRRAPLPAASRSSEMKDGARPGSTLSLPPASASSRPSWSGFTRPGSPTATGRATSISRRPSRA